MLLIEHEIAIQSDIQVRSRDRIRCKTGPPESEMEYHWFHTVDRDTEPILDSKIYNQQ